MWKKLNRFFLIIIIAATVYSLLSFHVVYFGNAIKILKKARLTSEYTFVNVKGMPAESILKIDTLREAGIGDTLVDMGKLDKQRKDILEKVFESDPVYY
ncbi:MAG: hypothetical protein MUP22_06165 [Desulfobacterales bacterium]|nr:hypothetical protein [Desulfobacterales bacterium]